MQILPADDAGGRGRRCRALRARIDQLELPSRASGPLTVSMGVAQYEPGEMIMQTFARADAALYRAKQGAATASNIEACRPKLPARRHRREERKMNVSADPVDGVSLLRQVETRPGF